MLPQIIIEKNYNIFWDFYDFIPNNKEIWVEIGSGNGDYLIGIAEKLPDKIFIGVEIKYKRLIKTLKKIRKKGLKNIILFHCSGEIFINFILKDNSISAMIFNFPDPWFKKRHYKRKIFNENFFNELIPKMKNKSKIFIATDYKDYAFEIFAKASKIKTLKNLYHPEKFGEKWLFKDIFTKYEKDFISQGKKIYYMQFLVDKA